MRVLLTGAAGFIGYHAARALLERGDEVFGLDNLTSYYSVALKRARLSQLEQFKKFQFMQLNIADPVQLADSFLTSRRYDAILHLAAQPGVHYSLENPFSYVESNVTGQVGILDLAAKLKLPMVYASSSSVYGANEKVPFAEGDRVDAPVSVYAATKRAGELLAHVYAGTHGVISTGLRFFTVYGRFGRPDMAPWLFTAAILKGDPISVFNYGEMERDFTHVFDITAGVIAAIDRIVAHPEGIEPVYNLGNNRPVRLLDFIAAIERATGLKATVNMQPKPPGDVVRTWADITRASRDLGFSSQIPLENGIADFVQWFREYHQSHQ